MGVPLRPISALTTLTLRSFLKRKPMYRPFVLFPLLTSEKQSSYLSGNKLGPVGVKAAFTHCVLQTETQQ